MNRDQFIAAKALAGVNILAQEGVDSTDELPDVDWMDVAYGTATNRNTISRLRRTRGLNYYLSSGFTTKKACISIPKHSVCRYAQMSTGR